MHNVVAQSTHDTSKEHLEGLEDPLRSVDDPLAGLEKPLGCMSLLKPSEEAGSGSMSGWRSPEEKLAG